VAAFPKAVNFPGTKARKDISLIFEIQPPIRLEGIPPASGIDE
jgi:hypothetical protein